MFESLADAVTPQKRRFWAVRPAQLRHTQRTAHCSVEMPTRNETHTVEAERQLEPHSAESFNRVAYALDLLKLLNPPMTVAVYSNKRQLQVEQGRALGEQPAWALCGIPPHASRASIARELVKLSGLEDAPFLVDLLVAAPVLEKS